MEKSKLDEFLNNILSSTKSTTDWYKPIDIDKTDVINGHISFDGSRFEYLLRNSNTKYVFRVRLTKLPRYNFFKNGGIRYILSVCVSEKTGYGSDREVDHIEYDSNKGDDFEIINEIYNFLDDRNKKNKIESENFKINNYIDDIKQLSSKSVIRDEKINTLLK